MNEDNNPSEKPNSTGRPGATPQASAEPQASQQVPDEAAVETVTSPTADASNTGFGPAVKSKKGKNKGLLAGLLVGGVLLLASGGSAAAYNLWYQNPSKVITDSLYNLSRSEDKKVTIKGSHQEKDVHVGFSLTTSLKAGDTSRSKSNVDLKVSSDISSSEMALNLEVSADVITDQKDDKLTLYIRPQGVKGAAQAFVDQMVDSQAKQYSQFGYSMNDQQRRAMRDQAMQQFEPIVKKIDNKWLKIASENLESQKQDDTFACYADAFEKLQADKGVRAEVTKAYHDNEFLVVKDKLGSKNGSLGYKLKLDRDKAKSFAKEINNTQFAKQLNKCDDSEELLGRSSTNSSNDDSIKDYSLEVWVDRWTHRLTKVTTELEVDGLSSASSFGDSEKGKASFQVEIVYGKVEDVELPEDAVDMKDLDLTGGLSSRPSATTSPVSPLLL